MKRLYPKRSLVFILGITIGFGGISACSTLGGNSGQQNSPTTETAELIAVEDENAFSGLVEKIPERRVIYIGETHDRYDHQLKELAVIRGLHDRGVDFAIGLKLFQRPFQHYLTSMSLERLVKKYC